MKNIKFRAWYEGEMIGCGIVNNIGHAVRATSCNFGEMTLEGILLPVGTPVMQFTGIKDKNRVEIYEGDIIKAPDNRVYTVNWHKISCGFSFYYLNEFFCQLLDLSHSFEVLGNIYEHPNLL